MDLGREKATRLGGYEIGIAQLLPSFREALLVGLKNIQTEQIQQHQQVSVGMELHFQKDERVHDMTRRVFVDNKRPVGYLNRASYVQKIVESRGSEKSLLA